MYDAGRVDCAVKEDEHGESSAAKPKTAKKREAKNAFTELLRPKKPKSVSQPKNFSASGARHRFFSGSDALGAYIANPAAYQLDDAAAGVSTGPDGPDIGGRVLFYTNDFVAIHDKFPKSSVHCLLLPRDARFNRELPLTLLSRRDEAAQKFLAELRVMAERLRQIVASELRRRFGAESAQDAAREAFLRGEDGVEDGTEDGSEHELQEPPAGRDWAAEVLVGVHAQPSMSHLHVHVLSRDMHSSRLRTGTHYSSFTTPFLVPLDAFPLADGGYGTHYGGYLLEDMVCWRCGHNFGNHFAQLKRHLDEEFEAWRRE